MILPSTNVARAVAVIMITSFSGCAAQSKAILLKLPAYAAKRESCELAAIPSLRIKVTPLIDHSHRNDGGNLTAAFGVPMGHILFDQSPSEVLTEAVSSELIAAGHEVSRTAGSVIVSGIINDFYVGTDTTPVYWDVFVTMDVALRVLQGESATSAPETPITYKIRCVDRTYLWPSENVITGVIRQCYDEFGAKVRHDSRLAEQLKKSSTQSSSLNRGGNSGSP